MIEDAQASALRLQATHQGEQLVAIKLGLVQVGEG
jgi:hypothetical protein